MAAYLALARAFFAKPVDADIVECDRVCDNKIGRFCDRTAEFGVLMPLRVAILTYHILHPVNAVGISPDRKHIFRTNQEYFDDDCARRVR